jgi:5-methylthioribose kinase
VRIFLFNFSFFGYFFFEKGNLQHNILFSKYFSQNGKKIRHQEKKKQKRKKPFEKGRGKKGKKS